MLNSTSRYPGAQPFSDTELSSKLFFGRASETAALADQILANRLVVVYAKSGLGKTSLLRAGVSPRLRAADCIPLFVRVNDIEHGPFVALYEGIAAESARQGIEYTAGDNSSLWAFFKTAQFWRQDTLLTPVLIIDQFEELFTLQDEARRDQFLEQLGWLVRGSAPPSVQVAPESSDRAPVLHMVLSLREDFLGMLEEAVERIPAILDHRYRLTPLGRDAAARAIASPAEVTDAQLVTPPFVLEPAVVEAIIAHLVGPGTAGQTSARRAVEPFHLQLICQRIEHVVASRGNAAGAMVTITPKDLAEQVRLDDTLRDFYDQAIGAIPERTLRPVARRLCGELLVSPEGRRLSVEERELQRLLKLPVSTLQQLVNTRLLRTDRRSDRTYYELSHDALVDPVLATGRVRALTLGWIQTVSGYVLLSLAWLFGIVMVLVEIDDLKKPTEDAEKVAGFLLVMVAIVMLGLAAAKMRRNGLYVRKRYDSRRDREAGPEDLIRRSFPDRSVGYGEFVVGLIAIGFASIVCLYLVAMLFGNWFPALAALVGKNKSGSYAALANQLFGWLTVAVFGGMCVRASRGRLDGSTAKSSVSAFYLRALSVAARRKLAYVQCTLGALVTLWAALGTVLMGRCAWVSHGKLPVWLTAMVIRAVFSNQCSDIGSNVTTEDILDLFYLYTMAVVGVLVIRAGLRGLRHSSPVSARV